MLHRAQSEQDDEGETMAHISAVENVAGRRVDRCGPGVSGRVDLLARVKLEGVKFWFSAPQSSP